MLSALAGRVVTGPLAFLVAGVLDVWLFAFAVLRHRIGRRLRRR